MRFLANFTTSSTSLTLCLKSDSVTCLSLFLNHRVLTSAMDLGTNNFYCLICVHGSYMLSFILNLTFSAIPFLNSQHKGFFSSLLIALHVFIFITVLSITCYLVITCLFYTSWGRKLVTSVSKT